MKKMIAPIIVVLAISLYAIGVALLFVLVEMPIPIKLIVVAGSLLIVGLSITVLVQRIIEIRKGEEDDLSKY